MALVLRERLLILGSVLVFLAVLPACSARSTHSTEALGSGGPQFVSAWSERQGFVGNARAIAGARIFVQVGCLQCHTYLGAGTQNLGAPDLSSVGKGRNRGATEFAVYVADPAKFGNDVMPRFADLGTRNLRNLGVFLEASKGPG